MLYASTLLTSLCVQKNKNHRSAGAAQAACTLSHPIMNRPVLFLISVVFMRVFMCVQPSSTLSSYVSACAYSPSNQYGVYSGPAAGYVAPGHHHWQPQGPGLSHPAGGMGMTAGDIHSPMTFKHQAREGTYTSLLLLLSSYYHRRRRAPSLRPSQTHFCNEQ